MIFTIGTFRGRELPTGPFLIGGRVRDSESTFILLLRFTGEGRQEEASGGLGEEVQFNLAGQLGGVIYKAKPQMLLPEKSPDQNGLL
jgi:hypothetical protein